jgi:hypothetical protein
MKLNVPLIKQTSIDSIDCGIAGMKMLFKFYKVKYSETELNNIHLYEGVGTYMPQLGEYLLSKGFEVEIITANPYLFTLQHGKLNQKNLLKYLEECLANLKLERFREPLNFFIRFVKKGGKLTVKVPVKKDLIKEISEGRPVCALITSNFLLFDKAGFNFHFNVITGIDNKYVYVNDPVPDYRGGKQKYALDDFFFALHSSAHGDLDNASLMKVRKK